MNELIKKLKDQRNFLQERLLETADQIQREYQRLFKTGYDVRFVIYMENDNDDYDYEEFDLVYYLPEELGEFYSMYGNNDEPISGIALNNYEHTGFNEMHYWFYCEDEQAKDLLINCMKEYKKQTLEEIEELYMSKPLVKISCFVNKNEDLYVCPPWFDI